MSKIKQQFICALCGCITPKWHGSCPECKEWNSLTEHKSSPVASPHKKSVALSLATLDDITLEHQARMCSGIREWDRVMGGGILPGAFMILTGDPGIGKSTLMLQIAHKLAHQHKLLYFSSEESLEQVKARSQRITCTSSRILFSDRANLDDIIATIHQEKPALVIIDSIQNCYTSDIHLFPGSIGQLKEAAFKLMRLAKEHNIAILLSGHITKDGAMAGPKTLEHMVDAVFYLQGDDRWQTRVLRSVKNRFGTVNELGFFEMHEQGLKEISNVNQHLLEEISHNPGAILTSSLEGSRSVLIELQALTIATKYSLPQRVISGIDQTQVILIAAILEKHVGIKFSGHDIFFKISGALKIKESSADLAIALALLSSFFQQPLPERTLALGEISLTGHIKPVNSIALHLGEAEKWGAKNIFVSRKQKTDGAHTRSFVNVYELLTLFEA